MEYSDNILHAAYLKHTYTHAKAHSKCHTQSSAIVVSGVMGVALAAENFSANEWYRSSAINNLFLKAASKGVSCKGMDLYCPLTPTLDDVIAMREVGINSFTFHKEVMDEYFEKWETGKELSFLEENNILVRCWSGKVSTKKLGVQIRGEVFHP